MGVRPFYETVYHRSDWTLADAFRPQPGWGSKRYTVSAASLPAHTDHEIVGMARASAPEGYRLTKVSIYPEDGDERILWSTAPDPRFNKTQGADHEQQ